MNSEQLTINVMAILPENLFDEFNVEITKLENEFGVIRTHITVTTGNNKMMNGNTYTIFYTSKGKIKTFLKSVNSLCLVFNKKYPKTSWKGK